MAAAITAFLSVWDATVDMITNSEYLMIYLIAGLIGTAFRIFKRAKKAVR